jgi:hypothetical protein
MKQCLTEFVNVGVVNLSSEENLGRNHGVFFGQEKLAVKHASLVGGLWGPRNLDEEMSVVSGAGLNINSHN